MPIINSVIQGGGTTPTGTKYITTNGVHDVSSYANADVQVPTTAPTYYIEKTVDSNGKLINSSNVINLTGATDLGNNVLMQAWSGVVFPSNTSIDFSSLTQLSGIYCCQNCFRGTQNIVSINLSGLTSITGAYACSEMFYSSTSLTSIDLSNLQTINATYAFSNTFYGCIGLNTIKLNALKTVGGSNVFSNMFYGCENLGVVELNSLDKIDNQVCASYLKMFTLCTRLQSVKFGGLKSTTFSSLTNQLQYLFDASVGSLVTGGCTVHFPSNFDPSDPNHTFDITTLAGYPTFGGNASYIHLAYDLPATE